LSAHLKKSQRVPPVSESTFNAANPAPAQVWVACMSHIFPYSYYLVYVY
jgi:hypothetical protein